MDNQNTAIREEFHDWLVEQGFRRPDHPAPGHRSYPGSHIQLLWDCWIAAYDRGRQAPWRQEP